jgi:hypothetical protein
MDRFEVTMLEGRKLLLIKSHDGLHPANKLYLILRMKTHFAMQLFKLTLHGVLQEKE